MTTLRREQCPECAKRGADRRKDNLAIYPDGHKYCYSCGYHESAEVTARLLQLPVKPKTTSLDFPDDYTRAIPHHVLTWLSKYGILQREVLHHRIGWSDSRKLLIFPVYDESHNLLMWQGRNFGIIERPINNQDTPTPAQIEKGVITEAAKPKYITKGNPSDIMHIIKPDNNLSNFADHLIVTEGVLDAIKVGRVCPSMPLWGSKMPLESIRRATRLFSQLGIWLDSDKRVEAVKTALRASQYMPSYVIASRQDPKEYDESVIYEYIASYARTTIYKERIG